VRWGTFFLLDFDIADVAKRLKEELSERNRENEMLKSWNGDPCSLSTWEGFSCEPKYGARVVVKLNFSSKNLQGQIPAAIGNLTDLTEIDLQVNNFTGSIPASFSALKHLRNLSVKCNPFLSNQLPDGLSTGVDFSHGACAAEVYESPPGVASQRVIVIGGVACGSLACTFALGFLFVCFNKRERRSPEKDCSSTTNPIFQECGIQNTENPAVHPFFLKSIQTATGNFKTLIGEGGFGAVYRGTLPHGQEVAVKVRSSSSTQGTREFNSELGLLSAVWHENLVPLIGYCSEKDQQILVYPFMSNGSLQDRLYGTMFHETLFTFTCYTLIYNPHFVLQVRHPKGKFLIGLPGYLFVFGQQEGWYICTILQGVVSYTEILNQATYFWITACVAR